MGETSDRYYLLSKDVKYATHFISNWEVFDFENLQRFLDEMKELQAKLRSNMDIDRVVGE